MKVFISSFCIYIYIYSKFVDDEKLKDARIIYIYVSLNGQYN